MAEAKEYVHPTIAVPSVYWHRQPDVRIEKVHGIPCLVGEPYSEETRYEPFPLRFPAKRPLKKEDWGEYPLFALARLDPDSEEDILDFTRRFGFLGLWAVDRFLISPATPEGIFTLMEAALAASPEERLSPRFVKSLDYQHWQPLKGPDLGEFTTPIGSVSRWYYDEKRKVSREPLPVWKMAVREFQEIIRQVFQRPPDKRGLATLNSYLRFTNSLLFEENGTIVSNWQFSSLLACLYRQMAIILERGYSAQCVKCGAIFILDSRRGQGKYCSLQCEINDERMRRYYRKKGEKTCG